MSAPPRFDAARDSRPITLQVSEKVFAGLEAMARKAGRTPGLQAQLLFDAAYAARCKPTGDRDLDEAVAAIDAPPPSSPKAVEALTEEWRGPAVLGAGEVAAPVTVPEIISSMPGITDMAAMMRGAWTPRPPSGDWEDPEERRFDNAIDMCCIEIGAQRSQLLSRSRALPLVVARLELYWCGTYQHGLSSPVIGRLMGGKDHSSVLSGRDRMTRLLHASGCHSAAEALRLTPAERRRLAMRFITLDDQPSSADEASADAVVVSDEIGPAIDAEGGVAVPPHLVEPVRQALAEPALIRGDPMTVAIEAMRQAGEVVMPHHAPALAIVAGVIDSQGESNHAETVNELAAAGAVQSTVPGAEDAGPALAEAEAAGPVVPAAGGDEAVAAGPSVPDRDAPDLAAVGAPPSPAAPPPAEPSAAQVKLMRQLRSIGNTPTEIADIMGLPADQVRAVLGQGKRR